MNLNAILLSLAGLMVCSATRAQEATPQHKDSLNTIIDEYYQLNVKVFQVGSTVADIDKVFSLFTDDFEYVHPKYGGTYSRQDLYNGYVRNQKNGGYDGSVTDVKVLRRIAGLNAVVTEKIFVTREGDETPQMALFEFRDGKISRIKEYW
ncbi:MAG: nuclear transport factor 2 family protein [Cytophagales bacterium]|nr:nuclear transport factor 2 family protein [Cytophagales bacterium]